MDTFEGSAVAGAAVSWDGWLLALAPAVLAVVLVLVVPVLPVAPVPAPVPSAGVPPEVPPPGVATVEPVVFACCA